MTAPKLKFVQKLGGGKKAKPPEPELLGYHLHKLLAGVDPHRSWETVHASDVTRDAFCARAWALHDCLGTRPRGEFAGTATRMVWKQGRLLAQSVAKMACDLGLAVADWECAACAARFKFVAKPDRCARCKCTAFFYREVRVTSQVTGISCGLDLLVKLPNWAKYRVFELKTLDKEKFKTLAMPLAEVRARTLLYLRCVAESDHPQREQIDTQRAVVFYISKGGWGRQFPVSKEYGIRDQKFTPFIEYEVERNDPEVELYAVGGKAVHAWRRGGPMPKGTCPTAFNNVAQGCPVRGECFSGRYPEGKRRVDLCKN